MKASVLNRFQYTLLLLLLGAACTTVPVRDKESEVFDYYLHAAFGDSIRIQKAMYLIVPEKGCKGCRAIEFGLLEEELNQMQNKSAIQFIFSKNTEASAYFKGQIPSRTDHSGLIDRINLPLSNITIVKTENRRISFLKEISADRMDSIGYYLR